MAIFDIIEDVSKKQVEKTDTGDSRIMGIMLGKVVKNYDKNLPGRVAVILLSREQGEGGEDEADNARLLWARVVMHSSGRAPICCHFSRLCHWQTAWSIIRWFRHLRSARNVSG